MCGFYDVSSAQHTACDIFSRTPDGTLHALEQESFLPVLLSVVLLLHPQAWTMKINGEKSAFS